MPRWMGPAARREPRRPEPRPTAELREALAEAGYRDVRTYLQSGTAAFTTRASSRERLGRELPALVAERFGVEQPVLLRSADVLAALVDAHPFGADTSATQVAFLADEPSAAAVAARSRRHGATWRTVAALPRL